MGIMLYLQGRNTKFSDQQDREVYSGSGRNTRSQMGGDLVLQKQRIMLSLQGRTLSSVTSKIEKYEMDLLGLQDTDKKEMVLLNQRISHSLQDGDSFNDY